MPKYDYMYECMYDYGFTHLSMTIRIYVYMHGYMSMHLCV